MRLTANLSIGLLLVLANPAIAEVKKSTKQVITASEVKKHDEYLNKTYINNYSRTFCVSHEFDYEDCVQQIKTCGARNKNLGSAFDTCIQHIQFKTG